MAKERITVDEVIDRYADMVYRLSFSQMKNRADADDLFQEVFVLSSKKSNCHRNRKKYADEGEKRALSV